MSLDLLKGVTDERAKALLGELSFDQIMGLLFAKAAVEQKRVNVRIRPLEARVTPRQFAQAKADASRRAKRGGHG